MSNRTTKQRIIDMVEEMHQISLKLRFTEMPSKDMAYKSLGDIGAMALDKASDDISYLAAELDTLVVQMDLAEDEWLEFVDLTNGGNHMNDDTEDTEQPRTNKTQYAPTSGGTRWAKLNCPSDESFYPTSYEDKRG